MKGRNRWLERADRLAVPRGSQGCTSYRPPSFAPQVEGLLVSAGNRIGPKLGDLPSALKPRLSDSNKNLTVQVRGSGGRMKHQGGGYQGVAG